MTLAILLYSLMMYSCMRSCMEETKRKESPGLPGHWAFIVSMFWFPILVIAVLADVGKGVKELLSGKD